MVYLGHKAKDGREQLLKDHLEGTGRRCADFAEVFGMRENGKYIGLYHDIGKYSQGFQDRIQRNGPKVDHSSAGAQEMSKLKNAPAAFCIAGHHSGLMDQGARVVDSGEGTLMHRLQKPLDGNLDFSAWTQEMDRDCPELLSEIKKMGCRSAFSGMFLTRMLFSCLVDADYLDTESFMKGETESPRKGFEELPPIREKYQKHIQRFGAPKSPINVKRSEILKECLETGLGEPGLYSLTVPTGGGKTIASLGFALEHAVKHGKKRIIYVIPYTSIIEQTADTFRKIVGAGNVLEHHVNVDYGKDETLSEQEAERCKLAAENWDAPLIVTTNVQFFESLFAARTSRCRKLHNIAESVVIFDEAQMLPHSFLLPCLRAVTELVHRYGVTAVLCTATQPFVEGILKDPQYRRYFAAPLPIREICSDVKGLYDFFRRVTYQQETFETIDDLIEALQGEEQALCVVNTKKEAQDVFDGLAGEGVFHLSTFMCPVHRREVLQKIRDRLQANAPCRVISTSLIEAGVDLDFPVVFRESAGLDSIIQAAGRCNREGKRKPGESVVRVFDILDSAVKTPPYVRLPRSIGGIVRRDYEDLASTEAVKRYFSLLYGAMGKGIDQKEILKNINDDGKEDEMNFRKISELFKIIESRGKNVFIPWGEKSLFLLEQLRGGIRDRDIIRKASQYMVSIYDKQFEQLQGRGVLEVLDDEMSVLIDLAYYSEQKGLVVNMEEGAGIFL